MSYIVETRLKKKQETHVAFIDFSKAYDRIDRTLLWHKLEQFGISGDFLKTLQALYADVKCSVRVNNTLTDWFNQWGLNSVVYYHPNYLTHSLMD